MRQHVIISLSSKDKGQNPLRLYTGGENTESMNKKIIAFIIVAILIAFGIGLSPVGDAVLGGAGGLSANSCTVTQTTVSVGDDISSTMLASAVNRAWATITQVRTSAGVASSSVSLSFGGTATVGNGYVLSTTTPEATFGLNTDYPFTGAVTGITNGTASGTVLVTQCLYN